MYQKSSRRRRRATPVASPEAPDIVAAKSSVSVNPASRVTDDGVDKSVRLYLQSLCDVAERASIADPEQNDQVDTEAIVNNGLAEIKGKESLVACSSFCSVALERLLPFMSSTQLSVLLTSLATTQHDDRAAWPRIVSHTMGSRVIERIVHHAALRCCDELEIASGDPEGGPLVKAVALAISGLAGYWAPLVADVNASHVARRFLQLLSGRPPSLSATSKEGFGPNIPRISADQQIPTPPATFTALLPGLVADITSDMMQTSAGTPSDACLAELFFDTNASVVLQEMLASLATVAPHLASLLAERLQNSLATLSHEEEENPALRDPAASHLVESVLQYSSDDVYNTMYVSFFRHKLAALCQDRVGNRVVQALVSNVRVEPQLIMISQELSQDMNDLIQFCPGVVLRVVEAAVTKPGAQRVVCSALSPDPRAVAAVSTKHEKEALYFSEILGNSSERGPMPIRSRIAQAILKFNPEISAPAVRSARALSGSYLTALALTPAGSRFVEVLISSRLLEESTKRNLISSGFSGNWTKLACDSNGWRFVTHCYKYADVNGKRVILEELAKNEQDVASASHGNGPRLLRMCNMDHFKAKFETWKSTAAKADTARTLFADIIAPEVTQNSQQPQSTKKEEEQADTLGDYEEFMQKLGFGKQITTSRQAQLGELEAKIPGYGT